MAEERSSSVFVRLEQTFGFLQLMVRCILGPVVRCVIGVGCVVVRLVLSVGHAVSVAQSVGSRSL